MHYASGISRPVLVSERTSTDREVNQYKSILVTSTAPICDQYWLQNALLISHHFNHIEHTAGRPHVQPPIQSVHAPYWAFALSEKSW